MDSSVVTAATAQYVEDQVTHNLAVMEAEEERRLAEEYDDETIGFDKGLEHDTRSGWLHGCNSQDRYAGKLRRSIVPNMNLPDSPFEF
jgi:hypothetical protein